LVTLPVMLIAFYSFRIFSSRTITQPTGTVQGISTCKNALNKFSVSNPCISDKKNSTNKLYKGVKFSCQDGSQGEFKTKTCLTYTNLKETASISCIRFIKCINTPTPTRQPYPSGWPTKTPTPTASLPSPIKITTNFLSSAILGEYYSAVINAESTTSAPLNMIISGLPFKLSQGPCTNKSDVGVESISCVISGMPTISGKFMVNVKVKNGINPPANKYIPLTVVSLRPTEGPLTGKPLPVTPIPTFTP
ncbi:MAG: hypothetical protein V1803_00565, partial [Candidatus Roizmanbacteria bacterium]